jgi:hypothetical protein
MQRQRATCRPESEPRLTRKQGGKTCSPAPISRDCTPALARLQARPPAAPGKILLIASWVPPNSSPCVGCDCNLGMRSFRYGEFSRIPSDRNLDGPDRAGRRRWHEAAVYSVRYQSEWKLTIGRFNAPGVDPDMLAEHYESEGFRLPMTITLIDQENRAIRGEITAGSTYTKYSRRGQGDGTGTERL